MKRPATPRRRPLRPQLEAFVRHYDANGGNGTVAYLASHPDCHSRRAASAGASELLTNPDIRARVDALAEARWVRLAMTGDEALARVALDARADIRELFDEHDSMLPIVEWPDSVAQSVKSVRRSKDGLVVILNDSLAARRLILEQTGKLKNPLSGGIGELARLLSGEDPEA